jgi:DNA-binding IclR family transcriptional regulator
MMDNMVLAVFQRMRFGCFYRVRDLVEESGMPESTVRYALTQLNRGGARNG